MTANQYGLARSIPDAVKLAVRQQCGFGCVICGSTIVEYEHFAPDYKDAEDHLAAGIALLCPLHHAQATKGILPKEQVASSRLEPMSLQNGFARENHPYFRGIPNLEFGGGLKFIDVAVPIMVRGKPVMSFTPNNESDITSVSLSFGDSSGKNILSVIDNEWSVSSQVWDFQNIANRYIIKSSDRSAQIILMFHAPNRIIIENANVFVDGIPLVVDSSGMHFGNINASGSTFMGAPVGIHFG